uniref:Uncharacterized protein n=1 Tax=Arundo donax TaxID=35708 RepID=A0A0A8ZYD9_ARUDO
MVVRRCEGSRRKPSLAMCWR